MSGLTLAERETIVRFDEVPGSPVSVYTHNKALIRDLEKRGFKAGEEYVYDGVLIAKHYNVPKDLISVRLKRQPSKAQLAVLERMTAIARQRRESTLVGTTSTPFARETMNHPNPSHLEQNPLAAHPAAGPKTDSRASAPPENGGCTP